MSGTSALLRRSCLAKSDSKTPVSRPSIIKVCGFDGLVRGQDKNLSTKESALANSFLFFLPSQTIQIGTSVFVEPNSLEAAAL